jgi:hypothetical protein
MVIETKNFYFKVSLLVGIRKNSELKITNTGYFIPFKDSLGLVKKLVFVEIDLILKKLQP